MMVGYVIMYHKQNYSAPVTGNAMFGMNKYDYYMEKMLV